MIAVVGISGSGKTYLIDLAVELYKDKGLIKIPAITTRSPRQGVDESANRIFVTEEDYFEMKRDGQLALINYDISLEIQ